VSYWDIEPDSAADERIVDLDLPDFSARLRTERGVFAHDRVDRGTHALLRAIPSPPRGSFVDLGAGYGPIAITLARRQPDATIWAVDRNRRALRLTAANARTANATGVITAEPTEVPAALRFDGLYSNPPIKIGKEPLYELIDTWLRRLLPGSAAWLVCKQSMGADSLHKYLSSADFPTTRAGSKQGYRLLRVDVPGQRDSGPDPADLAAIPGKGWRVLGRLAGGFSDPVYLLRTGNRTAVLKIKYGRWWPEQLARLTTTTAQLRQIHYPTADIIAAGELPDERAFLLTEFLPGTTAPEPTTAQVEALIEAIDIQRGVHPPEIRDWSAMVTMFLNGGLSEASYHPTLAGRAARALALTAHPVPALPSGDFVHGDLTTRNSLFTGDRLTGIIDLEGFGRGTPAIDLVALAACIADPGLARLAYQQAVDLAGADVAAACLSHRILAGLAWATEHPELLTDAGSRADRLLALVR
jgi:16S rRNA (guanine1207-N2)-methyltransferase